MIQRNDDTPQITTNQSDCSSYTIGDRIMSIIGWNSLDCTQSQELYIQFRINTTISCRMSTVDESIENINKRSNHLLSNIFNQSLTHLCALPILRFDSFE